MKQADRAEPTSTNRAVRQQWIKQQGTRVPGAVGGQRGVVASYLDRAGRGGAA